MKYFFLTILIVFHQFVFAQNNFKIEFSAPAFEKDSLFLSPPMYSGITSSLYAFEAVSTENTSFYKEFHSAIIRVKPKNLIEARILYPQPISFSYYDKENNEGHSTKVFFLEKGNLKISVNGYKPPYNILNPNSTSRIAKITCTLNSKSPANLEYEKLKNNIKIFDDKLSNRHDNDLKYFYEKQAYLQNYIIKQPDSYVAFWELVNDFSSFGFNKSYLMSLKLFSLNVKKTHSYVEFKKILEIENSTNVGGNFPEVIFNSNDKIVKSDFANYKVTLIDYWATFCTPCIKDLPKLVELYDKYRNRGVNFISVTDENKKEKIDLALKILENNNVSWKNHFDVNKEFPKILNALGYPLQILVDSKGKIIARKLGELDQIEAEIKKLID